MKRISFIFLVVFIISGAVFVVKIIKSSERPAGDFGCDMYRDEKGVYQMVSVCAGCEKTERLDRPDLDPETFRIIDDNYSLDKNSVYNFCSADSVLLNADPNTFKVYKEGMRLAHDSEHVYYNDYQVVEGDPDTFTELSTSFHKDENNVYFVGRKIDGANPEYFTPMSYGVGYDNRYIYDTYRIVYEIDPGSFYQVDEMSWRDKNYNYCLGDHGVGIIKSKEPCG